jgi:hypothetical protein
VRGRGKVAQWVDRLLELTGWDQPRWECEWGETEAELGVSLPADYKELCARFGPGTFAEDYLTVLADQRAGRDSLLRWWQGLVRIYGKRAHGMESMLRPHKVYGINGRSGVIPWGHAAPDGVLFWLADAAVDPDSWPVIGKYELALDEEWHRFDLPASEFVYRALTDTEFWPFSVERWGEGEDVPRTFWRLIMEPLALPR